MKILSVAGLLQNDSATWRIFNIASLLQARGHEIHLVQYAKRSTMRKFASETVELGNLSSSIIEVSELTIHIKHLLNLAHGQTELVYGNTHMGAFYSILTRLKHIPLIFDMHGGLIEEFSLNNLDDPNWKYSPNKVREYTLDVVIDLCDRRFSSKILCVSNKMIKYLNTEKKVPLDKMVYVTNGIDLEFFKPKTDTNIHILKARFGLEGKFVIGYIGAQAKWQGIENLIQTAKVMNNPDVSFVFVGGNITRKDGNVSFFSKVPRSTIADYYSVCDVLVLPRPNHLATEIAAPTKFAEYSAMGKPILTTNVGDAAELVKKYKSGVIVRDNTVKRLVDGILELKNESPENIAIMGHNSRVLAEREFDWDKVANNLTKALDDVVKTKYS